MRALEACTRTGGRRNGEERSEREGDEMRREENEADAPTVFIQHEALSTALQFSFKLALLIPDPRQNKRYTVDPADHHHLSSYMLY